MGIMGEDRLTCVNEEAQRFPFCEGFAGGGIRALGFATIPFVVVCLLLLANIKEEAGASLTSPESSCRAWGVFGLVLCALAWLPLLAWRHYIITTTMRLVERCPPAQHV